jgi:hypothetical protein
MTAVQITAVKIVAFISSVPRFITQYTIRLGPR